MKAAMIRIPKGLISFLKDIIPCICAQPKSLFHFCYTFKLFCRGKLKAMEKHDGAYSCKKP